MNANRRGVLAALLCSPPFSQNKQNSTGTTVIELDTAASNVAVLEVRHQGKAIKFTADELMDALEPLVFPEVHDYPPIPVRW